MEEVNEFKYLRSVMCKHGGTEGETRERALQGRKVVGSLGRIMKGRSVSMEVKLSGLCVCVCVKWSMYVCM